MVQKQALEAPIDPAQETMRYQDAALPVKERVEDLAWAHDASGEGWTVKSAACTDLHAYERHGR